MKLLAFAASSSTKSINKQLVTYAASLIKDADVEILDINDYEMPLFSQDKEEELGRPIQATRFFAKIGNADGIIITFAEHNGSYTAAYKNLFDWVSRIDKKVFQDKPVVMLATSPGPGGANSVLTTATLSAPFFGADVKARLSIPNFYENFDMETGTLRNEELNLALIEAVSKLKS